MVISMEPGVPESQINEIVEKLENLGFDIHRSTGKLRTVLGVIGDTGKIDIQDIRILPGVSHVHRISVPYKLASRSYHHESSVFTINGVEIGGKKVILIAGPCAIETEDQLMEIAKKVSEAGATILRGGAFKPRSSPYSFQGMGEEGLKLLRKAADRYKMLTVSEVMDKDQIELVAKYTDILQVGARNMQNFSFIRELGKAKKPVFLKRGLSATFEEWLMAAEYILSGGNKQVILCERGIRTFETYTRNTLDISAIPIIHKLSHLPIFADPSHGTGLRDKVTPMARAAVAAGADGLMIEVHNDPENALSDGAQSLFPDQFTELVNQIKTIANTIGKEI